MGEHASPLVNFLIIGAHKCGTTWLHNCLSHHPQFSMSTPKEPCFFAFPYRYGQGVEWYESLFDRADGQILFGESSTTYTNSVLGPEAPRRIFDYNRQMRLIYLYRDPYERIESAWIEWRSDESWRHRPPRSFNKAVRTFPGLLEASLYHQQISEYVSLFGRSSIHIVDYETIKEDPAGVLDSCLEFLGADPHPWSDEVVHQRVNVSAGKKHERRFSEILRGIGLVRAAFEFVPERVRLMLRRARYEPLLSKPTWDEKTRAWASRRIEADHDAFIRLVEQGPSSPHDGQ